MRVLVVHNDSTVMPWLRQNLAFDSRTLWDEAFVDRLDVDTPCPSNHTVVIVQARAIERRGLRYISALRRDGYRLAVVMIADDATQSEQLAALDAGADACFTRAVAPNVLSTHVRVVLRRIGSAPRLPSIPAIGDITIDRCAGRLVGPLGEASLTRKDIALLTTLLDSDEYTLSRGELLRRVWGYTFDPGTSVFDVALSRLRAKLSAVSDRVRIVAQRGYGFRLVDLYVSSAAIDVSGQTFDAVLGAD